MWPFLYPCLPRADYLWCAAPMHGKPLGNVKAPLAMRIVFEMNNFPSNNVFWLSSSCRTTLAGRMPLLCATGSSWRVVQSWCSVVWKILSSLRNVASSPNKRSQGASETFLMGLKNIFKRPQKLFRGAFFTFTNRRQKLFQEASKTFFWGIKNVFKRHKKRVQNEHTPEDRSAKRGSPFFKNRVPHFQKPRSAFSKTAFPTFTNRPQKHFPAA